MLRTRSFILSMSNRKFKSEREEISISTVRSERAMTEKHNEEVQNQQLQFLDQQ